MKPVRLLMFCLFCAAAPAGAQTNGIFADFSTSKGDFTVYLDHAAAPRAVASFVGLATGEGSWADNTGNVWTGRPFYDGSLIHRIVKDAQTNGIAIQGGGWLWRSVNTNTGVVTTNFDNAGYKMLENVTNGLMHSNGVISMANSGPNTDGSQFFITTTNVPSWDGGYTVFGHVTTGMNVVTSIAAVAVQGSKERPVEDIVVSQVVIRREGSATNFNIASQGVPVVESGPIGLQRSGTNELLVVEIKEQTAMLLRETSDLVSWESSNFGTNTGSTIIWTSQPIPRVNLGDTYFFHMSRIWYPVPITSPANVRAQTVTFWWDTTPAVKYEATFSTTWGSSGSYIVTTGTNDPISGTIFAFDTWSRDPYSARLGFVDDSGKQYSYSLGFNPGQVTNRFTGTYLYSASSFPISGVFTVSGP